MSKKKFSLDPDYLTRDAQAEVITMTSEPTAVKAEKLSKETVAIKKAQESHKISDKFGSHLDALFQEPPVVEEPKPTRLSKRVRKALPRMGLDSLIRNTRNPTPENTTSASDEQKRVTFVYSRDQLEKVRQISKFESIFMKDIIGEAVNQWLERYERNLLKAKNC